MKTKAIAIVTLLVLGIAAAAATALAQASAAAHVKIPFGFVVGKTRLPAGNYLVGRTLTNDPAVLVIRSQEGRASAMILIIPADRNSSTEKSKLLFHRYGDRYFLSQVWIQGDSLVQQLPMSRQEKELSSRIGRQEVVILAEGISLK